MLRCRCAVLKYLGLSSFIVEGLLQGPLSEELTFIVLDTNIVLHYLEVIDHFITDIETLSLPVMVIIPGVVINELDGYDD